MRRKLLLSVTALFVSVGAWAQDYTENNVNYYINGETAYVGNSRSATGDITILGEITVDATNYPVTEICASAFYGCTGLMSITLPDGLTTIGNLAFEGCANLATIDIPESVTSTGYSLFSGTAWYNSQPDGLIYVGKVAYRYKGAMPENTSIVLKDDTKSIGEFAFSNTTTNLTSITIPEGVSHIGASAFGGCTGLTSIVFPESMNTIGAGAFDHCSNLNAITIPENVTKIGKRAFWRCTGLTSITVAAGNLVYDSRNNCNALIETTSNRLLQGCNNTVIPNGVTHIEDYAFYDCDGLTSITLPDGMISIGAHAFSGCSNLTEIDIPESVTTIGRGALDNAWLANQPNGMVYAGKVAYTYKYEQGNTITSFTISLAEGTTGIAAAAFENLQSLDGINIPNTVTTIGESAFSGCSRIEGVTIPSTVTTIGSDAFSGCIKLRSIVIPSSVSAIEDGTFKNCWMLGPVTISEGVTSIGSLAFYRCDFSSITLPKSITFIDYDAFCDCSGLSSVVFKMKNPPEERWSFDGISSSCVLTVPYGTTAAYEAAGWTTDVFGGGIVEAPQEDVTLTIGSAGMATYCYDYDLDFSGVSGLEAYIVSGFSPTTGKLTLTPVTEVPAGEGLLLRGTEGSYEVPFTTTDMYYSNLLKGVTTATTISPTDGDNTNFILADGKHGIGFYTISEAGELAANKAYLQLPTSTVSALSRDFIQAFNDDTTDIDGVTEPVQLSGQYYDLQGRRVAQPANGIYILNGRKVIIK